MTMSMIVKPFSLIVSVGAGSPAGEPAFWRALFRPPISLSRIFVRVGNGLNGPTFTIPDSMPGSLDCAARELQSPGYSVDTVTNPTMPQAVRAPEFQYHRNA